MNFIKVLAISTLVSSSFAADVAPSVDVAQINAFRGNWTETFQLTAPFGVAIHTPTHIRLEGRGVVQGARINLSAGVNLIGAPMPAALILNIDSTRDEFVQALQRARIYSGNYNGAQPPAAAPEAQKAAAKQVMAVKKAEAKMAKNNAALAKNAAAATKQIAIAKKAEVRAAKIQAASVKKQAAIVKKQEAADKKIAAKQAAIVKKQEAAARKVAAKQAAIVKKQAAAARKAVRA